MVNESLCGGRGSRVDFQVHFCLLNLVLGSQNTAIVPVINTECVVSEGVWGSEGGGWQRQSWSLLLLLFFCLFPLFLFSAQAIGRGPSAAP